MQEKFLYLIIGLVAGLATVFAPWVKWPIEKRKQIVQNRRDAINSWRRLAKELGHDAFLNTPEYATLRRLLSSTTLSNLENSTLTIQLGGNRRSADANYMFDAIAEVEAKWGLLGSQAECKKLNSKKASKK